MGYPIIDLIRQRPSTFVSVSQVYCVLPSFISWRRPTMGLPSSEERVSENWLPLVSANACAHSTGSDRRLVFPSDSEYSWALSAAARRRMKTGGLKIHCEWSLQKANRQGVPAGLVAWLAA